MGGAPVIQAHTPLSIALGDIDYFGFAGSLDMLLAKASRTGRSLERIRRDAHEVMLVLLRAGAKLGTGGAWGGRSETMLERLIGDERGDTREVRLAKVELKHSLELIKAVRAAGGTWRNTASSRPSRCSVCGRSWRAAERGSKCVRAPTPRCARSCGLCHRTSPTKSPGACSSSGTLEATERNTTPSTRRRRRCVRL